jgi:hypothetical protein
MTINKNQVLNTIKKGWRPARNVYLYRSFILVVGGGEVVTLARALRPTYAPGGPFIVYTGKQSYSQIFSEWNVLKKKEK